MLYREIIVIYYENRTEHMKTVRGQIAELVVLNLPEHVVSTRAVVLESESEGILGGVGVGTFLPTPTPTSM
jgi:hypothetical protein